MHTKIKCYIAAGEGERAKKLALAIAEDPRFESLEVNRRRSESLNTFMHYINVCH